MTQADDRALAAAVDPVFAGAAADCPGLLAGVVRGGRLAHVAAFGKADLEGGAAADVDTVFRIASVTKQFTALALLILRDEGVVELDAPLSRYVPQAAALAPPTADSPALTLRLLLNHTAGFVTDDPWADRCLGLTSAGFDALIAGRGLFARPPGLAVEYSNLGYALVGRAIRAVTGAPAQRFVAERLLKPLGMAASGFDFAALPRRAQGYRVLPGGGFAAEAAEPDGEFGPMGGLAVSGRDFSRWIGFLLDAWPPRDDPQTGPASRATVRELAASHAPPFRQREDGEGGPSAYGFGLVSSEDPELGRVVGHAGGLPGWGSHMLISPETGIGLFAFANRTYAPMNHACRAAAVALKRAGLWRPRPVAVDPRLERAGEAVRAAYNSGAIESAAPLLALNLLPDEPAAQRNAAMAALRRRLGEARSVRLEPRHALAGRLVLACARGEARAQIALAPGPEGLIQTLGFEA